jgi:hypothetical protein
MVDVQVKKTLVMGPENTHEQSRVAPCHHISEEERKKGNFESEAKRKEALLYHSLQDTLTDNLQMTPSHIFFFSRKTAGKKAGRE